MFFQVLSLFIFGYALMTTAMNQPFGFPGEWDGNATLNPDNLTMKANIILV